MLNGRIQQSDIILRRHGLGRRSEFRSQSTRVFWSAVALHRFWRIARTADLRMSDNLEKCPELWPVTSLAIRRHQSRFI
jgi:hypothetical protein